MTYPTLPNYSKLSWHEMADATQMRLWAYSAYGYENAGQYSASYLGAAGDAVFSFQAVAGAIYSLQSSSYREPGTLLVFDHDGYAIAEDDYTGEWGTDHVTFVAPYTGTYYVDASWWQGSASDQLGVSLEIYEDLATLNGWNIDGTMRGEEINGTASDDNIFGFEGRDSLFGGRGNDYLDGGTGLDEAFYNGNRDDYYVRADGDRFKVTDDWGSDGTDLLSNIERLDFKDIDVALDIDGAAGEAYRLYQAAFNRTPDLEGLGFWISKLDAGMDLGDVARGFVGSDEFRLLYGAQPNHVEIVTRFYHNVLHRAPDQEGLEWWVDVLDTGKANVSQVLVGFSESEENYARLIGTMENGIEFIPFGQS